ncbi:MAG TPA: hypothetical protein VGD70_08580 [Actinophytocola sp.]
MSTPPAERKRGRLAQDAGALVRNRVAQLVAVLVLGGAIGAGVTALVGGDEEGDGGDDRGGHSRQQEDGRGEGDGR